MAKKEAKKKTHSVSHSPVHHPSLAKESSVNPILIENFVSLQRVLTNLSVKLDNLSTQMGKLLDLFELSAKALAEKDFELGGDNKDVVEKLNKLLDQNKILAKGISLMHERIPREQYYPPQQMLQQQMPIPQKQQMQNQQQYIKELPKKPTESIMKPRNQRMSFSQEIPESEEELIPKKFESPLE